MMSFVVTLHLLAILTMYIKCSFYSHYTQQHLNLGKPSKTPQPTIVLLFFSSLMKPSPNSPKIN